MPSSGTFIIRPTSLSQGGTPLYDLDTAQNGDKPGWYISLTNIPGNTILSCANNTTGNFAWVYVTANVSNQSFVQILRFQFNGACIYLDGSVTPISFFALPSGFTALTAAVSVTANITSTPAVGSVNYYLEQGALNIGPANTNTYPYSPIPTIFQIVSAGIGFSVNMASSHPSEGVIYFNDLIIQGTYQIQQQQSQFSTPLIQNPQTQISTGSNITINASSGGGLRAGIGTGTGSGSGSSGNTGINPSAGTGSSVSSGSGGGLLLGGSLNPINQLGATFLPPQLNLRNAQYITLSYYDTSNVLHTINISPSSFITWTANQIVFTIPDITVDQPKVIYILYVDNGQQFSGSVLLGALTTIYFLDGSGIYFLNVGKGTDTLYVQGTGQIVEVAIPNPFIKTGFIP